MEEITVSKETYGKLLALKNHWSFSYRRVTNKEVLEKLDSLKKEIFGYSSNDSREEIERISTAKTRDQLEKESEGFQKAYRALLESGLDFAPEYKIEEHIKKMIELIEDSDEMGAPLF